VRARHLLAASLLAALATAPRAAPPHPGRPERTTPAPASAPRRGPSYGPEPEVTLTAVEESALDVARDRLGGAGPKPRPSTALALAARELARSASRGTPDPLAGARLRAALAQGLAFDAAPAAVLVEAPAERVLDAVADALQRSHATHVGAGAFERDRSIVVVVLASDRRIRLAPFPREVAPGTTAELSGTLGPGLSQPRVFLTLPGGAVREVDAGRGPDFKAALRFAEAGRYAVEVIGDGDGGPQVAALFAVSAGGASLEPGEARRAQEEPADDRAAEAAVIRAVNETRRRQGLPALAPAPELADVARRHSAAMARQGRVAHVVPGSGELGGRLRKAGVPYARAYENVARASTALGAHDAAEASPAHRENLLRADATRVGVGIVRATLPSGDGAVYLTEVFVAPPDEGEESPLVPDARVREALWHERQKLGLPALSADPALDELAREAAQRMHRRDAPDPEGLGDRALALRRRALAAVDVFVASAPAEATRSSNLRDARFRRVGVGVAVGDSRRYGAGRFWIAVVYTD
jgi:uncharacterized protein YkwD